MSRRFSAMVLVAAAALMLATWGSLPVRAEAVDPEPPKPIEPPSTLPRAQTGDKAHNLDRLFEALKVAPDEESAKYVENRIWAIWLASPSDTANLLMERAKTAVDGKDLEPARHRLLHQEGFRQRGRRHPRGARARAAPFRGAVRAGHHSAGDRRREA